METSLCGPSVNTADNGEIASTSAASAALLSTRGGWVADPVFCPECGRPLRIVDRGKWDPFFGCTGFPECRVTRPIAEDGDGGKVPVMTERDVEAALVKWLRS